ncbi:helix-turn-helix domain-containing protein [Paenibacillus sp. MMO-177]|uniref:helix-turn-helix domain-containing protein n=1 Tax=Paenibacillus sp. MMO-177 TaxID=3081289 RepID=UPI0030183DE2
MIRVVFTFKEIRLAKQLEVNEVAALIGVPYELLMEYEKDSRLIPCSIAMELCALYRVPTIDLIYIGKLPD